MGPFFFEDAWGQQPYPPWSQGLNYRDSFSIAIHCIFLHKQSPSPGSGI